MDRRIVPRRLNEDKVLGLRGKSGQSQDRGLEATGNGGTELEGREILAVRGGLSGREMAVS